uniref:Pyroglutamyl-peptidase 1 n=1 Tax=Trichobilharzia regenti TaxID=157069 RepID=A0AA85JUR0_TRIRE|nr:unnamed protein product [Trichobilharzia regenti]
MRIVVTGFGLFGSHEENSSSLAVHQLKKIWDAKYSDACIPVELHTIENVPVAYGAVDEYITSIWKKNPDLVIHVGMHTNVTVPTLETQSYNHGYNKPDIDGTYCANDGCVSTHGKPVLQCEMDLNKLCEKLIENHISCSTSNNPGNFLCGYIYYKSLQLSADRVVFVHVPSLDKMSAEDIARSLLEIIRGLAALKGIVIPQK